jgi:hypothetical protein
MRPQDIAVLLKIIALKDSNWRNLDLANGLFISPSEISEALNRCKIAKLIDAEKKMVHFNALSEFLIYGLKYVFPAQPGAIVRGMPTAHSSSPIKEKISENSEGYVWSYPKGTMRGQQIIPLYKTIPAAAQSDKSFYELMVITDTIRIGRAREINIAIEELEKRLAYA